jgi:hypothetical protein
MHTCARHGGSGPDWPCVACRAARRIIGRLPDGKRKAEEYAAAGLLQEAAECAARVRDGDMLSKLQVGLAAAQVILAMHCSAAFEWSMPTEGRHLIKHISWGDGGAGQHRHALCAGCRRVAAARAPCGWALTDVGITPVLAECVCSLRDYKLLEVFSATLKCADLTEASHCTLPVLLHTGAWTSLEASKNGGAGVLLHMSWNNRNTPVQFDL